jgi:DNA-binding response OmpR family regulator
MASVESAHSPEPLGQGEGTPSAGPAAARLAIIDSDSGFVRVLAKRIGAVGWRAHVLGSPPPPEELRAMRQHAIVIDVAMLGAEAWAYLGRICAISPSQVVVVCTGPTSVAQRVRGLRLGADDWVTKPCHPEEVLARVEAALRARQAGSSASEPPEPVVAGELEIRPDMFEAFVGGRALGLTRREFELIQLLSASEGRVIPRERIYERVWGYAMAHGDRSVDVFVRKLRKKLEAASPGWRYLHTHFGVGYRFDAQEADDSAADEEPPGSPEASGSLP